MASTPACCPSSRPGPVRAAADCDGYGRELPRGWRCPRCDVAQDCYAAMLAAQGNGHNGDGREAHE